MKIVFTITNCQIVRPYSLPYCIHVDYKFMCLAAYGQ